MPRWGRSAKTFMDPTRLAEILDRWERYNSMRVHEGRQLPQAPFSEFLMHFNKNRDLRGSDAITPGMMSRIVDAASKNRLKPGRGFAIHSGQERYRYPRRPFVSA